MIACPQGSTGQYHGPPNQARDIVRVPSVRRCLDTKPAIQPFHTDNGDVVSLYALSTSHTGGSFYLANASKVYQEVVDLDPRLAKCLRDDWVMVRYEYVGSGALRKSHALAITRQGCESQFASS